MPYVPYINDYKPFYIQATADAAAKNTATEWGMVAKSNPYPALPEPKEPYKNDWKDANGDDEYVASIQYKAFTFEVQFYLKTFDTVVNNVVTATAAENLRSQLSSFFTHIKSGEFKVFDEYTGLGRQKVRFAGYAEEGGGFVSRDNWARLIFKITFKVNDPITAMKLQNGSIVAIS